MQKIILLTAMALLFGGAILNSQDTTIIESPKKVKDYSVAVHIHPMTLINLLISQGSLSYIYTTVEIPCSPSYSFMIRPSLWDAKMRGSWSFGSGWWSGGGIIYENLYRIGTDLGVRHYTNKKVQDFYVQATLGVFHRTFEDWDYPPGASYLVLQPDSESFWEVDIMGYIGGSIKPKKTNLTIFCDIGIGVGTRPIRLFTSSSGGFFSHFNPDTHFRFDWNFGLGYRF